MGTDQHWRAFYNSKRPCMADLIVDETLESVPNWYSGKYSKSPLLEKTYVATDFFPDLGEKGRWLRFSASAIKDAMGNLFGAIETLEDITDQKIAEEELVRIKNLESMGTFAGQVAQDFDSLMSAVLRNIFLAKLSAADEDKILEEGLATAERASLQAKELAHQLITFAKGGYPVLKLEAMNGLLEEVAREGEHPGVEFIVSIAEGLWPVEIDAVQIKRVLGSIVQNAVDAMPEGGSIHLSAENVHISDNKRIKRGNYLKISIRDSGHGIKPDDLARIFDPYFTTKKTRGRKGIGLGLSLCYSIMKNHRGSITVESELGKGTTFHLLIPAPSAYPNL
jgi:signal transduction histidine kinase